MKTYTQQHVGHTLLLKKDPTGVGSSEITFSKLYWNTKNHCGLVMRVFSEKSQEGWNLLTPQVWGNQVLSFFESE